MTEAGMGIPFRCGAENELCFNSGVCVRNDTQLGEYCLCPDGYIHDFVMGRFPNCGLPTWFLPAYFAFATVGTIWSLYVVLPHALFKVRARLQRAAISYCLSVIFQWLHVLCVFIQQGNQLPALIMLLFFPPSMFMAGYSMFRIVIDPVCTAVGGNMTKRRTLLRVYFITMSTAIATIQASTFAYADVNSKEARDMFNMLFVIQMFLMASGYPLTASIIVIQSQYLMKTIQSSQQLGGNASRDERLEVFFKQLDALVRTMKAMSLNVFFLIPIPICVLVLGSMPYQFVFWALNMSAIWPTAPIVKKIIMTRSSTNGSSQAAREKSKDSSQTARKGNVKSLQVGPIDTTEGEHTARSM